MALLWLSLLALVGLWFLVGLRFFIDSVARGFFKFLRYLFKFFLAEEE
jgi:hypothetical protein